MVIGVQSRAAEDASGNLARLGEKISKCAGKVDQIRRSMNYRIAGREQIQRKLSALTDQITAERNKVYSMSDMLATIARTYHETEQKILGQLKPQKPETPSIIDRMDGVIWGFPLPFSPHPVPVIPPWRPLVITLPVIRIFSWLRLFPGRILPKPLPSPRPPLFDWIPHIWSVKLDIVGILSDSGGGFSGGGVGGGGGGER